MKEIQTYIRVCNVEFTKGLSYYRIWQAGSISFAMRLFGICKNRPTIKSIAIMEYAIAKILVCAEGAWSALNFLHGKKV